MKAHILALGAHPDDVEIAVGGTLLVSSSQELTVVIADATTGGMSTNGTVSEREHEAQHAARLLGAAERVNVGLPSNQINPACWEQRLAVARLVRTYQPEVILLPYSAFPGSANPEEVDRHPDHRNVSVLLAESLHLARLARLDLDGLEPWLPRAVIRYSIHATLPATGFVVDISAVWARKMEAILAHRSQFVLDAGRTRTALNGGDFLELCEARARLVGAKIDVEYGEAFFPDRPPAVTNILQPFGGK